MNRPLVSAIIPVFNGERFLAAALQSVFGQDYRPIEVIVVDDGSVDASADIVRSYQEALYIYQENRGVAAARNRGLAVARGEFIALLDADDVWTPNKLSVQIGFLLDHPEIGYTFTRQRTFLDPGCDAPRWVRNEFWKDDQTGFLPSTMVTRKSVFERVGVFDPSYRVGEDTDWFCRAKDAGIPMAVLPEMLLHKRIHNSNLTGQTRLGSQNLLRIIKTSVDRQRRQGSARA